MTEFGTHPDTFLYDEYIGFLSSVAAEAAITAKVYKDGWVDGFEEGGISAPNQVGGYFYDVTDQMHATFLLSLYHHRDYSLLREVQANYLLPAQEILTARQFRTADRLYRDNPHGELGMRAVAFGFRVLGQAVRERTTPDEAVKILEDNAIDEQYLAASRHALDWSVMQAAKNANSLEGAKDLLQFASTEEVRLVMDSALDRKVLQAALRAEKGTMEPAHIIAEYASSVEAREAMLGYIAGRHAGVRTHSTRIYASRLEPVQVRVRRREAQKADARFVHYQAQREEQQRQREDASRRRGETAPNKLATDNPFLVQSISAELDDQFRTTFLALDRTEIARVVAFIRDSHMSDPSLTPQRLYRRSHHASQVHESPELSQNTTKILAILLQGDFSKTARFPRSI